MTEYVAYPDNADNMVLIAFEGGYPIVGVVTPIMDGNTIISDVNRLLTATCVYGCDLIRKKACKHIIETFGPVGSMNSKGECDIWDDDYGWYFKED